MTRQAAEFPVYLNNIGTLMDVEVCLNAATLADDVSSDENADAREFKAITVSYAGIGVHGASKALFIRAMQSLVACGNPAELRIEWADDRFSIDREELENVSAHLMVVGHSEFGAPTACPINGLEDLEPALAATGIDIRGVSMVEALNMPEPQPHRFVSPVPEWSLRPLFVSLMLAAYDTGKPLAELELYWRQEPKLERPGVLQPDAPEVFIASARALIVPKQRIVVERRVPPGARFNV